MDLFVQKLKIIHLKEISHVNGREFFYLSKFLYRNNNNKSIYDCMNVNI